ncbi:hypothetical protein ACLK19_28805 [Escherichia coli]
MSIIILATISTTQEN